MMNFLSMLGLVGIAWLCILPILAGVPTIDETFLQHSGVLACWGGFGLILCMFLAANGEED